MKDVRGVALERFGLKDRQFRFCEVYLADVDRNQKRAYLDVYPNSTERNAEVSASKLLSLPKVAQYVQWRDRAIQEELQSSQRRIVQEYVRVGFCDPRRLYNDDGTMKLPKDWDDDLAAAIAGIEVFEEFEGQGENRKFVGFTKKVKFWNKVEALNSLAKHRGMFPQAPPIPVSVNLNINYETMPTEKLAQIANATSPDILFSRN